jgi:hypothetical protein
MPPTPPKVWTTKSRLLGNLIPMIFCIPFLVVAILLYRPEKPFSGWPLFMGLFLVSGWTSLAIFGYWGNDSMRAQIGRKRDRVAPPTDGEKLPRFFVGMARPSYRNALDPHEDVGFVILHSDRLEFFGDELTFEMPKETFKSVRFRMNPHTILGLGRWISLEGEKDGQSLRLYLESRESSILIGNWGHSERIRAAIAGWLVEASPRI